MAKDTVEAAERRGQPLEEVQHSDLTCAGNLELIEPETEGGAGQKPLLELAAARS